MGWKIKINGIEISTNNLFVIAGPCIIESEKLTLSIAETLTEICREVKIPFIFKASYDKANRSSIKSYRGPGPDAGLKILKGIKERLNIPVLTDVHCREEIKKAKEIVDVIQIPAYLSRQTDLLLEAGRTGKAVNVKKGQFLSPWDMKNVVEKIKTTGNKNIILTERGTSFGYNYLVSDFRSIVIMKKLGFPVVFDATHSIQVPGGRGNASGGEPEFIEPLARAAVGAGADGIFIEVHPHPEKALSDGPNSLKLSKVKEFLKGLLKLYKATKQLK